MNSFKNIPTTTLTGRPSMPTAFEGQIYESVGKYARQAILFAFEQLDGPEGLAEWASTNKEAFYTKLFPKIVARESEVKVTRSIDDLMDVLDGQYEVEDAQVVESPTDMADPAPDLPDYLPIPPVADLPEGIDLDDLVEFED